MTPSEAAALWKITETALPEYTERVARCLRECGPLTVAEIVEKFAGDVQPVWVEIVLTCRANRGRFNRLAEAWNVRAD